MTKLTTHVLDVFSGKPGKGIKVEFKPVAEANHFFSKSENDLTKILDKYIKKETALY